MSGSGLSAEPLCINTESVIMFGDSRTDFAGDDWESLTGVTGIANGGIAGIDTQGLIAFLTGACQGLLYTGGKATLMIGGNDLVHATVRGYYTDPIFGPAARQQLVERAISNIGRIVNILGPQVIVFGNTGIGVPNAQWCANQPNVLDCAWHLAVALGVNQDLQAINAGLASGTVQILQHDDYQAATLSFGPYFLDVPAITAATVAGSANFFYVDTWSAVDPTDTSNFVLGEFPGMIHFSQTGYGRLGPRIGSALESIYGL